MCDPITKFRGNFFSILSWIQWRPVKLFWPIEDDNQVIYHQERYFYHLLTLSGARLREMKKQGKISIKQMTH